ncbi:MAG TPA: hypothetical protein VGE81_03280, partial [Candidatus Limnocylindrales bacterium]
LEHHPDGALFQFGWIAMRGLVAAGVVWHDSIFLQEVEPPSKPGRFKDHRIDLIDRGGHGPVGDSACAYPIGHHRGVCGLTTLERR